MALGIDEPISIKTQDTTGYYHTDGLGTVREITSSTGAVINQYSYDAWGNQLSSVEQISQPFTFTAREWDSGSGLYYYRARYMDATVGRFTSMDPALGNADDPFSFHGYSYVANNPVNLKDQTGRSYATCMVGCYIEKGFCKSMAYVKYGACMIWAWVKYEDCKYKNREQWGLGDNYYVECRTKYEDDKLTCEVRKDLDLEDCENEFEDCKSDCASKWHCE